MFYGQKNYNDKQGGGNGGKAPAYTIADIGCFVTSFCNLEQRFGKNIDPPSLNRLFTERGIYIDVDDGVKDDLGWSSISAYDGQIQVSQTGGAGWPPHSNSIVKFAYTSPRTHTPMTHFCLVADTNAHTIVDSWDGAVRSPGYYGEPVAWATYNNVVPEPVVVAPPAPVNNDPNIVLLKKGDTITSVALSKGYQAQELLDHNGLTWAQARNLPIGYPIKLPIKAPVNTDTGVTYQAIEPKVFHIKRDQGAEKWMFGNVKSYSDFKSNGHVAPNINVTIVGVATVSIGKEKAAYYMESVNFGDFVHSGQVANTIGYNWSDLEEGEFKAPVVETPPVPTPTPEPVPAPPAPEIPVLQPPVVTDLPEPVKAEDEEPNEYKTTLSSFTKPMKFWSNRDMMLNSFDNRGPENVRLKKSQPILIQGTFLKGQTLYGLEYTSHRDHGYWFGVPMSELTSDEDLFTKPVTLAEKAAMHYALSLKERYVVAIAKLVALFKQLTKKDK